MTAYDRLIRQAVRAKLDEWRRLRAWQGACDHTAAVLAPPSVRHVGVCRASRVEIMLRPGQHLADALATILHEYAHVASLGGHGPAWARVFAEAVREVTGVQIVAQATRPVIDAQATDAVSAWLAAGCPTPVGCPKIGQPDTDGGIGAGADAATARKR